MTQKNQRIITRQIEVDVLRQVVGGATQLAVAQHFRLSKGTVSKLVNGVHKFSPNSGEPHKDLPMLRDAIAKRSMKYHMEQCLAHLNQFANAAGATA